MDVLNWAKLAQVDYVEDELRQVQLKEGLDHKWQLSVILEKCTYEAVQLEKIGIDRFT